MYKFSYCETQSRLLQKELEIVVLWRRSVDTHLKGPDKSGAASSGEK